MFIPKALYGLERDLGAEVFVVGGTVRDLVRQKKPNDSDYLVRAVSPADFEEYLRGHGELKLVGQSFGVYLFRPKNFGEEVEIAFPRTEVSTGPGHRDFQIISNPELTLEEDAKRRDFTLNAMYLPIRAVGPNGSFDLRQVVDFHQGLDHIRNRLIMAVGQAEDRINEDPLRMLRAMVLISRTGFRLEGDTFMAIRRNAKSIQTVAAERVRDEFVKIMESQKPSRAFKAMYRTGLLREVLPELADCVGCGQNPKYHSYPVFEHLIYATDAACQISDRLDVRFGTLCHDLGKAPTREVRPGGDGPDDVSFHNHEIESTRLTYEFMMRLKFPRAFMEDVIQLVRQHQYKYDRSWTDKAVRRFIRTCDITEEDLKDLDRHPQFLVRQADRMGNKLKAHIPITVKQKDFQERIKSVYKSSSAHSQKDLAVNGSVLQEELNLKPSPIIGKVLKYLFDLVEEEPSLNTREALLTAAKKFISGEENGSNQTNGSSPAASQVDAGDRSPEKS